MSLDALTAAALAGIVPELGASGGDAAPTSLPRYFYEDLQNTGTGDGWLWNAGLWSIPNVFPLIRLDTRYGVNASGSNRFFESGGLRAPGDAAADTVRRLSYWIGRAVAEGEWPAGKPLEWGITIVGPNAADSPLSLVRDPADRIPGFEAVANRMSMYPATGVAACRAWFEDYWPALALELELQQTLFPPPAVVYTDFESIGDVTGIAYLGGANPGAAMWPATRADPRANTYLIDGVHTLSQWLDARTTTLAGDPIPEFPAPGTTNIREPGNADRKHLIDAAYLTSYIHALSEGVFAPLAALWPDTRRGEWAVFTDSRRHPVMSEVAQLGYQMNGYRGLLNDANVVNYSAPHVVLNDTIGPDLDDWAALYPSGPPGPLLAGRVGKAVLIDRTTALRGLGMRVAPSIALGLIFADQPAMREALIECADAGTRDVWIWGNPPGLLGLGQAYAQLIRDTNAAMIASGRYFNP